MNSLYLHIPFCAQKCFYCSFVVSIGQEKRMETYLDCLKTESDFYKGQKIDSVYFGGGTPTMFESHQIKTLVEHIKDNFEVPSEAEWTIEANPDDITLQKAQNLKDEGIGRVSLGVQTFNDHYLKYLGRNHDCNGARKAFEILKTVGFSNISIDLMYGFPKQSLQEIDSDIKEIASLDSQHISLYSLTIEKNSRFFVENVQLAKGDVQAEHYNFVVKHIEQNGFKQYEISNFSKEGFQSSHNINYWKGGNYIGLGIGAHSHSNGRRYWNISNLTEYIECIQKGRSTVKEEEELTKRQRQMELILMGLRMNQGINLAEIEQRMELKISESFKIKIDQFIDAEYLFKDKGQLIASSRGRLVLDELSVALIEDKI